MVVGGGLKMCYSIHVSSGEDEPSVRLRSASVNQKKIQNYNSVTGECRTLWLVRLAVSCSLPVWRKMILVVMVLLM